MLVGAVGFTSVAPAAATGSYSVSSAIKQGSTWLKFSNTPTYANTPKLTPGVHDFRVTLTNHSPHSVSITSINLGIPGAPTTCVTASIRVGKSGSCTVPVTIVAGSLSFGLTSFLSSLQTFVSATHQLIGVSYDLTTTMTLTTPGGTVSPGDPSLATLPVGFTPRANLTIRNNSSVTITSVTVPGFRTSSCGPSLKTIAANTLVVCNGVPVVTPASSAPVVLTTGAVGNGVFPGDRPGLGIALTYQGIGGCTATLPTVLAGTRQTLNCSGLAPGIKVGSVLHSTAVSLGSHVVAPDGTLTFAFTVPLTTTGGAHQVSIVVSRASVTTAAFRVTAVELPVTGSDPALAIAMSLLLVLLGAGLLWANTARRRARASGSAAGS